MWICNKWSLDSTENRIYYQEVEKDNLESRRSRSQDASDYHCNLDFATRADGSFYW